MHKNKCVHNGNKEAAIQQYYKIVCNRKYYSYSIGVLQMATSEPLSQRPTCKSWRMQGQELQ